MGSSVRISAGILKGLLKTRDVHLHSLLGSGGRASNGFSRFSTAAAEAPVGVAEVVIVGAKRTPFGRIMGSLSSLTAPQLGAVAIKAAVAQSGVSPDAVQEVIMGNSLSAGIGQAPARQAALAAGLPFSTDCTTVNKVCASGLKAVMLAAQAIATRQLDVAVAGGMESMSHAPHLLPRRRVDPRRVSELRLTDSLEVDGLLDAYKHVHMLQFAEDVAVEMHITREEQDEHAVRSYERAAAAQATHIFEREIVPVDVPSAKGDPPTTVSVDEDVARFDPDRMPSLRAISGPDGTVTAGNAPALADGAAALVLTSATFAKEHGLKVLARIRGFADAAQEPKHFPTSPAVALTKAAQGAGCSLSDLDLFEINEAFSVVDLANQRLLGLSPDEVNVHGGAVALGHPLGASGARILVSLINAMAVRDVALGAAAICNGGGGASAMIVERETGGGPQSGHIRRKEPAPEAEVPTPAPV